MNDTPEAQRTLDRLVEQRKLQDARAGRALAALRRSRALIDAVRRYEGRGEDVRPCLELLRDLAARQEALEAKLAEATQLQKQITEAVVPGMFYYLLTTAILVTLCGFLIIAYPEMRIQFIAGMGVLFVGFVVFYLLRMQRYRSETGRLQERLAQVATEAEKMVEEIGEREERLRSSGLALETDSYVEYRPALAEIEAGRIDRLAEVLKVAELEAEAERAQAEVRALDDEIEAFEREHPELATGEPPAR